jgi:hypothetical protein
MLMITRLSLNSGVALFILVAIPCIMSQIWWQSISSRRRDSLEILAEATQRIVEGEIPE